MSGSLADRRSLLGAGALVAGAGMLATSACAQKPQDKSWKPAMEDQDAWLDMPNTRHRMVFDTTSFAAASAGMNFAHNFFLANDSGYGLKPDALGVVLILRSMSTPFGYNDSIWAKYGSVFANFMKMQGDTATRAKTTNPLYTGGTPSEAGGDAVTLAALQKIGVRFAICGMATHGISGMLAKGAGKTQDEVEADIKANLISGAVLVPAGIVAVNRAQERGFTLAYVQG